jgi:tellurite resistance protein TerC
MEIGVYAWGGFVLFVLAMLALDLGVFNRNAHEVTVREALLWTAFWVSLAAAFCGGVWYFLGQEKALEFMAGYLIEESLSMDNLFVFLLVFRTFRVPAMYEHKALFWGVLGALAMRAVFIVLGVALINRFHWIVYCFGAFLVVSAVKMALEKDREIQPEKNPLLILLRKFLPVSPGFEGGRFFVRRGGVLTATPLLAVVLVLETTDVIFAVDSIPAVLAVTRDPFIVYTSNAFAILGLRSLFFALAGMMRLFHYLHCGLVAVLLFVGAKMLMSGFVHIPIAVSLAAIAAILTLSVCASLVWPQQVNGRAP